MATPLLDALQGAMYKTAEDPWALTGSAVGQIAPSLINPYGSTGSNLGIGIGSALLAGLLGGLGQNSVDRKNKELYTAFNQLSAAPTTEAREAILEEYPRLTYAQTAMDAVRQQNALDIAQKQQELNLGVEADVNKARQLAPINEESDLTKALLESGYVKGEDGSYVPLKPLDPANKKRREAEAAILGTQDAYGVTGAQDPNSPQYKENARITKEEDDRRKEITGLKVYGSLQANLDALPALEVLAKDNTSTSDIPFTYKFIQGQDGGVVKEGEIKMVQGGSPLLKQFEAQINKTLNGESGLTPALKMQMVEEMRRVAAAQLGSYKEGSKGIIATGLSRGANEGKMHPFDLKSAETLITPKTPQVPEGFSSTGRTAGGKPVYANQQGQMWVPD